jgi:hypothetical protein
MLSPYFLFNLKKYLLKTCKNYIAEELVVILFSFGREDCVTACEFSEDTCDYLVVLFGVRIKLDIVIIIILHKIPTNQLNLLGFLETERRSKNITNHTK